MVALNDAATMRGLLLTLLAGAAFPISEDRQWGTIDGARSP
jgi:hypothetical protein